MFPVETLNTSNAVLVITVNIILNGEYHEANKQEIIEWYNSKLTEFVFGGTSGFLNIQVVDVIKGSIIIKTESRYRLANMHETNTSMGEVFDNVKRSVQVNHTHIEMKGTTVNQNKTFEDIALEKTRIEKLTACDPEVENVPDCDKSQKCRSDNITSGSCVHKCDVSGETCGGHGHCLYDDNDEVVSCRCNEDRFYVYFGAKCESKTPTMQFVLALSLGIGLTLVTILIVVVVCILCRRRGSKTISGTSSWSRDDSPVDGFRSSTGMTLSTRRPFRGNYYRTPLQTNNHDSSEDAGNDFVHLRSPLYFPADNTFGSGNSSRFDRHRAEVYRNIDTHTDYTLPRPYISLEPHSLFYPESKTRRPLPQETRRHDVIDDVSTYL